MIVLKILRLIKWFNVLRLNGSKVLFNWLIDVMNDIVLIFKVGGKSFESFIIVVGNSGLKKNLMSLMSIVDRIGLFIIMKRIWSISV